MWSGVLGTMVVGLEDSADLMVWRERREVISRLVTLDTPATFTTGVFTGDTYGIFFSVVAFEYILALMCNDNPLVACLS